MSRFGTGDAPMAISLLIWAEKKCASSSVSKRRRRSRPSGSRQMTWILLPRSFRGFTMTCCFRFLAISGLPARPTPSLEIGLDGIEDDFFHGSVLVCSLDLEFDPDGLGQVDCGALGQPLLLGSRCFPASHNHRYSVM